MPRNRRYLNVINGWDQTAKAVAANTGDAPFLEAPGARLAELAAQALDLNAQKAALTAAKQEANKKLQEILREGESLADFVRTGARQRYGSRSEKLVEFGMQPFRGLKTTAAEKPPVEPGEPAGPPNPTSDTAM